MSTGWEQYRRESDKTLWVHIFGNHKSEIVIEVNKWWHTRYPNYKLRICNKQTFESIKEAN